MPDAVSTRTRSPSPASSRNRATQRTPFPHISASLPSALYTRIRTSASCDALDREQAVRADAAAPVADPDGESSGRFEGRAAQVDDDEVVVRSVHLGQGHAGHQALEFPDPTPGAAPPATLRLPAGEIVETACL